MFLEVKARYMYMYAKSKVCNGAAYKNNTIVSYKTQNTRRGTGFYFFVSTAKDVWPPILYARCRMCVLKAHIFPSQKKFVICNYWKLLKTQK